MATTDISGISAGAGEKANGARADASEQNTAVDFDALERDVSRLQEQYRKASPFPHIVIDDFLSAHAAEKVMDGFPGLDPDQWNSFLHANERKFSNTEPTTWSSPLQDLLEEVQSDRFVTFLKKLTGIEELFSDESLEGGGLHQSLTGGFLNVHADFTVHPRHRNWQRRVNLLLYLNKEWPEEYGGSLELWSADMKRCEEKIAPVGNRAVIFNTDADSFHGHPEPMACPQGVARQSLALYYFTEETNPMVRSTEYRARPGDGARSVVIYLDKEVLRAYDWAKRRLGLSDHSAGKLLSRIERLRRRPR